MGSSAVLRTKTHLEKSEIEKISQNSNIDNVFKKQKNVDGFLTIKELKATTNGLVDEKILKKIIQICGSKKDKMTNEDFLYFYALLNTSSFKGKLNFLLDFIFIKNDNLSKEKYIHKINKYFSNSELLIKIFLENELIQNSKDISREKVYSFVEKNYKSDLEEYPLYINSKNNLFNHSKNNTNNEENDVNDNTLILANNNSKEVLNTSDNSVSDIYSKYDSLSDEFKNIERKNNGIFPISVLEDMLREINVIEPLIKIIGNYITKKTKKSFLNFDLFKEILSLLISEETNSKKKKKEIMKGLFTLISYPNDYINRNYLLELFEDQPKIDSLKIGKQIDFSGFYEIKDVINNILSESLEHIQYLKYIFFKEEIEDHSIELKCFLILIDKFSSLENYILERLQFDKDFYLIDLDFWNTWINYVENFEKERNYNDFKKLRMNTTKFCDSYGKILEGKEYLRDFIVISETMQNLFINWYGKPKDGVIIVRNKIYLDNDENNSIFEEVNNYNSKNNKNAINFIGIERKTGKKFALELYPVYLRFYLYMDFIKKGYNSLVKIKNDLRKAYREDDDKGKYHGFSIKTKFLELAQNFISDKNHIEINNIRFWVYRNDKFMKASFDNSLEELGITNKAIVLIEIKVNNVWPSEKFKKDSINKDKDEELNLVGLNNIGNTCYMNSILQIFLNMEEIRNIFIHKDEASNRQFLSFILNTENKEINNIVQSKGYLVLELIKLLREKWLDEKRILTPSKFKEICGEYNSIFKTREQQDAHDFYTFLIDKLHEETNIISNNDNSNESNELPETIETDEIDLANTYWANEVRKNSSFFYALFMGQLKSTLICSECKTKKIKFEPFSALEIPISEGNNIIIEIILFRLPYSLRKFNLERINEEDYDSDSPNYEIRKNKKSQKNLNDENSNTDKNAVFNNLLNLNIPLKLKLEISRKEKCLSIINKLKCMSDLNIEKNYYFTEFIMISKGKFINEDLLIDETFSNFNTVFVYELLNYKGIINIFDYQELDKAKILSLKKQEVNYYNKEKEEDKPIKRLSTVSMSQNKTENKILNIPSFYFQIKEKDKYEDKKYFSYELLIPIFHRIKKNITNGFVPTYSYQYFYSFQDFIILSSSTSIKPCNLYEMMWKKYMYFLNSPANYDNNAWWKLKKKDNKKDSKNLPFIITIINKDTSSCSSCPWFRFCTGCILDPFNSDYININSSDVIIIEWDKEVFSQEIDKSNFSLIINHSSVNSNSDNSKNKIETLTIDDCLKLFTKKEEIKDIQCEKCQKKTLFMKTLEIERLPKYLVLVLKRFKYILTNIIKIQNIIKFPLENLPLQNYVSQKNINYQYNLYGIINHYGQPEDGHYYSIFNINGSWIKFDDSQSYETNAELESNQVYMLIYQSMKSDIKSKNLNFMGVMRRAYKLYIHPKLKFEHLFNYVFDKNNNIIQEYLKNCNFFYGEPVIVNGKRGYIIRITKEKEDDENSKDVIITIKLNKGIYNGIVSLDKIEREIYKKKGYVDINTLINYGKGNKISKKMFKEEEEEALCGSKVCLIY